MKDISATAVPRLLSIALAIFAAIAPAGAVGQSVSWPAFGPVRDLLHLDGLTDVLPDLVGPVDGSAELTIFTEGNHFPVLLPLVLERFPAWCNSSGSCRIDPAKILVVTLPQPMVVDILLKGGVRLGNAIVPVGRERNVFPDLVMGGEQPLRRLAEAGIVEKHAVVFARHRGMGLLLGRGLEGVHDLESFGRRARAVVLASDSEAGARNQYRQTMDALVGPRAAAEIMGREVRTFPGRLGIQHRDVPYAVLNGVADGGIVFGHLAAFYARHYPDRLANVEVDGAERFGQTIAMARSTRAPRALTGQFERFFREAARTAYPSNGFSAADTFDYGSDLQLSGR